MRWYRAKAYVRVQTAVDELHNPVYGLSRARDLDFLVRIGPRKPTLTEEAGNSFDTERRTLMTRMPATLVERVAAVDVADGESCYSVDGTAASVPSIEHGGEISMPGLVIEEEGAICPASDSRYAVESVSRDGRYTVLTVRRCKPWAS